MADSAPHDESDDTDECVIDYGAGYARLHLDLLACETPDQKSYPFGHRVAAVIDGDYSEFRLEIMQAFQFRKHYLLKPERYWPVRKLASIAVEYLLPPVMTRYLQDSNRLEILEDAITAIQSGALPGLSSPPYSATVPKFCLWLRENHPMQTACWIAPLIESCRVIEERTQNAAARSTANTASDQATKSEARPTKQSGEATSLSDPSVRLPTGTQWRDVRIKFKNGDSVTVWVKGQRVGSYTCAQLGMGNHHTGRTCMQWQMLLVLADSGEISSDDNPRTRQRLSAALSAAFGLPQKCIVKCKNTPSWKPAFKLDPESRM